MVSDKTDPLKEVECPECGHVNEYDPENDTLLCEECDELIFVDDEDNPDEQET